MTIIHARCRAIWAGVLATWLVLLAWPAHARPAGPGQPAAGDPAITGNWASTSGSERIVFSADGRFRTCIAGGGRGNAALGLWRRQAPGRYQVEFTHTAATDCNRPAQPLRQHRASIVGQVQVSRGELALYVSGEFPPDIYRPLPPGR